MTRGVKRRREAFKGVGNALKGDGEAFVCDEEALKLLVMHMHKEGLNIIKVKCDSLNVTGKMVMYVEGLKGDEAASKGIFLVT